ncbi:hypothetical protein [Bacillus mycoides]|uniref:hypothetical protein n=1 Tax=Bacillus mycoides TaxID=1405 RepID=UPI001C0192E9|nr:hypothetical protein [Bacillus mycoides]
MKIEMSAVRIEDIYQEILDGERKKFPSGTWIEDVNNELKSLSVHLYNKIHLF